MNTIYAYKCHQKHSPKYIIISSLSVAQLQIILKKNTTLQIHNYKQVITAQFNTHHISIQ